MAEAKPIDPTPTGAVLTGALKAAVATKAAPVPAPTAADIAKAKSEFNPQPLTASLFRALRGDERARRHLPPEILLDGRGVKVNAQTVEAIVWHSDQELYSPEVLGRLMDIEARMRATLKMAEDYSLTKVADAVNAQRDAVHAALQDGQDLSALTVDSREHIALDFRTKQSGLMAVLVRTTHDQLVPLAKPILNRFAAVVEQFMREREEGDRDLCAGFGLRYHPSLTWKAAAAVALAYVGARRIPQPHAWAFPSAVLAGIVNFNE
jgi:predicted DNA-binding protein YlxM (UPF0122 family)